MRKYRSGRSVDTIFVLVIFSIFAFSVLLVLMLGASVYRNINDISRDGEQEHTALSYIWTKSKNFDNANSIHVGDFEGVPALFIDEAFGDTEFRTAIYYYDGWLYELFSETGLDFSPADGVRIVQADTLSFNDLGEGLIEVTVGEKNLILFPRSGLDFPNID